MGTQEAAIREGEMSPCERLGVNLRRPAQRSASVEGGANDRSYKKPTTPLDTLRGEKNDKRARYEKRVDKIAKRTSIRSVRISR